jgi:hypothetical protein
MQSFVHCSAARIIAKQERCRLQDHDLPKPGTSSTKGDSTPAPDVCKPKNAAKIDESDLCDTPNQESDTTADVAGAKKEEIETDWGRTENGKSGDGKCCMV